MLALLTALGFAVFGLGNIAAAQTTSRGSAATVHAASAPTATSGTTVDPLQYNCGIDAPACGHVGESNAYYDGTSVNILYTENWYCDANVKAKSTTGCEVGTGPSKSPSATSSGSSGTSLGNTTVGDAANGGLLYIPIPLYALLGKAPAPASTQCPSGSATVTCIDHPPTVDLSALDAYIGAGNTNDPIPLHNHVIGTRGNAGADTPQWWNVEAVAATTPAAFASMTSVAAITAAEKAGTAVLAPSNVYLFFQVMPGTESAAMAANNAAITAPGAGYGSAPNAGAPNQAESGTTYNNLRVDCEAGGANCENLGIAHGYVSGTPGTGVGQDVQLLYSENYYCGTPESAPGVPGPKPLSSSGCEVGYPGSVPPGVADTTLPTAANSAPGATGGNGQIDPLYIPVPLGFTPVYTQCPTAITCIDHPMTVDLSAIAKYLPGDPAPSAVANVPLPSHDHVLRTRNADQPEWWNVEVVPVTSQAQLNAIESGRNLTAAEEQPFNPKTNGGGAIDTNVYLWFQTLPGSSVHTPGPGAVPTAAVPTPGECTSTLPAGTVVAGADLPDGAGYVETDSAGDVAVFGGATCYGSLTGIHLNKPVVGIAVDRNTGGYWLVGSDGGIFNFNAPYYGSTGNIALNKPVVGIATNLHSTGYTLVASDGGIFTFNLPFHGSVGNIRLNKPVVGLAYDPATASGYYLVASDGGIFDFGGAKFYGSTGNVALNKPIVALSPLLNGTGYTEIAADGGTFQKGSAPFLGSLGSIRLNFPIVSAGTDLANDGFTDFAGDGGVFTFNSAFYGSAA